MSKTNVYTLIATALLGALLVVVLQFARKVPTEPITANIRVDPAGPTIGGRSDILAILESRGFDAQRMITESADWRRARGFLHTDPLFGVPGEGMQARAYDNLDFATLESMSEQGDPAATQALAARTLLEDLFASLDFYATAASQGSIFAMLRIGALRETLSNVALESLDADPSYVEKLAELRSENSQDSLQIEAFAYVAAAIRDGGVAIVDQDLLDWIQQMGRALPPSDLTQSCELSERLYLKLGAARRSRGLPQITTQPPSVFLGIPDLLEQLPCRSTGHSIIWLLDLSRCSATPVNDADGRTLDLYICQN